MTKRLTCTLLALALVMWTCPLTVYYLGDHHVLDLDLVAVQAGTRTLLSFPMPGSRVRRIVIQVDPTGNNSVGLVITQGGFSYSHSSDGIAASFSMSADRGPELEFATTCDFFIIPD